LCFLAGVKILFVSTLAVVTLNLLVGCAGEPPAARQDGRIGARAGVTISSHDMSRVVPTRPEVATTN
jgi:hypothetical protein